MLELSFHFLTLHVFFIFLVFLVLLALHTLLAIGDLYEGLRFETRLSKYLLISCLFCTVSAFGFYPRVTVCADQPGVPSETSPLARLQFAGMRHIIEAVGLQSC